jgi:hypothetical protein
MEPTVIIMVFEGGAGWTTGGRFERSSVKFLADEDLLLDFGVCAGEDCCGGSFLDISAEVECAVIQR